ncbi:Calcium-dependent protein kinase 5 (PfCDPK5) [Durusdinium trenchii]|uniref:Calcium-dependent protein kinase 5 (PfCDPK5) n=1 Tax=Durusdinium trenchii TaxID=1381693 RepID=A0ABP0KZ40_9DINO
MLKSLDHPHIVRVFEAFESTESLHIVMDYAEGGDLASVIRETLDSDAMLPHIWVQMAALQVASALDYMHSRGVIHCDLKPGNTMLLTPFVLADALAGRSKPHVLLVDFGLAEIFDEQAALGGPATVKGSPAYLSPEGFDGKLTQKSDTWALGVMLFEMLVGTRPFRGTNNIFVLYCQVANTEPAFDKIPPAACSLVRSLMDKNPQSRMSARQCFEHEWLQQVNTSAEYSSVNTILPKNLGRHTSYFHRAVTFSMAAALGMKELTEDYQLFQALDADKSGQLDQDELRSLAKGLRQDLNALMASMDLDQDGQISYTEFLGATLDLEEERGDRLMRYAFSTFDHDGDGNINMEELRRLLSGTAMLVSDVLPDGHTVDEVMEEVSGGDGVISFSRFRSGGETKSRNIQTTQRHNMTQSAQTHICLRLVSFVRSYLMHVKHGGHGQMCKQPLLQCDDYET